MSQHGVLVFWNRSAFEDVDGIMDQFYRCSTLAYLSCSMSSDLVRQLMSLLANRVKLSRYSSSLMV